jgi:TolB-like protein/Tfp pilus assembly protein PilF
MGLDEVGTARTLREHRKVTDALVAKHGGRLVKTTGDGVLLEFPSVVDAVECAVAVQAVAEPGGICVSSSAYDQVRGKVAVEFTGLGEQKLKNIALPIRAYAVGLNANTDRAVLSLFSAPRLSIVVLPFANIGSDPEQQYFVDGVIESLTTDLSRISGSFVIAHNTALTFKGKAVDVKKLGHELNVRYVLEGSMQRGGNRLRVNVQLVDAETGNHLWAERFDKPIADLFVMQDEIVSRLANSLGAELIAAEARRAERSPHPDAMDLVFQGRSWFNKGMSPDYMAQARSFFEKAIALDPGNIEAMVGLARVDASLGGLMTDDWSACFASAETTVSKALSRAPNHASAHVILGRILIFTKRVAHGIAQCEQALALDRNLAEAHGLIGMAKFVLGRGAETEIHIHEALRLSPRDVLAYRWFLIVGLAKTHLDADAEATVWLRRSLDANPNYSLAHFHLAATLALLGELDEARAAVQAGLALDPSFTLRRFRDATSAWHDSPTSLAGRDRTIKGMRMVGVPEG